MNKHYTHCTCDNYNKEILVPNIAPPPPAESRSEFLEKLQRARSQVKPVTASQPILSSVGPTKLTVGNWSLTCLKDGEIAIHNSDGQQATILKEDLPGFVFESNRGTKHSFTAETSLGEF